MSGYNLKVKIEQVENGQYLATSKVLPGLVAQRRTFEVALEIARDVARKLIESYTERQEPLPKGLLPVKNCTEVDLPVVV